MSKIKIIEIPYGKRKGYHLVWKRETLAGPFKTTQEAFEAKSEWIVPVTSKLSADSLQKMPIKHLLTMCFSVIESFSVTYPSKGGR